MENQIKALGEAFSSSPPEVVGTSCVDELKRPITATLRALEIDESATFPIERYGSVVNTVNRLRTELARKGWKCVYKKKLDTFEVKVRRIS